MPGPMGRRTPSSHRALGGARVLQPLGLARRGRQARLCATSSPSSRPARCRPTSTARRASANRRPTSCSPATASSPEGSAVLREAERFALGGAARPWPTTSKRLAFRTAAQTSFRTNEGTEGGNVIAMEIPESLSAAALDRRIDPMPFVPVRRAAPQRALRGDLYAYWAHGLARPALPHGLPQAVVGTPGGLDSTLRCWSPCGPSTCWAWYRNRNRRITMPGFRTTQGAPTTNALQLMRGLGVTVRERSRSAKPACST